MSGGYTHIFFFSVSTLSGEKLGKGFAILKDQILELQNFVRCNGNSPNTLRPAA